MSQRQLRPIAVVALLLIWVLSPDLFAGANGEPVKLWVFVADEASEVHLEFGSLEGSERDNQKIRQDMLKDVRKALEKSKRSH